MDTMCKKWTMLWTNAHIQYTHFQTCKMHFLYNIQILGNTHLPQKVRNFSNNKFATKQKKLKKTINRLQIIKIQWKYAIISLQNTVKTTFPLFFFKHWPQKNHKFDNKVNLQQNTVYLVTNLTHQLKISHHPWWCVWWHFASLLILKKYNGALWLRLLCIVHVYYVHNVTCAFSSLWAVCTHPYTFFPPRIVYFLLNLYESWTTTLG